MPTPIVQFENVRKHYQMGLVTVEALRGVSFGIAPGDYISIMGQSKLAALVRELNWTQNLLILARVKRPGAAVAFAPCSATKTGARFRKSWLERVFRNAHCPDTEI